jgi:signal transduction histidine kinase
MARSTDRLPQLIYYLAASFIFGAVFLRTLLVYRSSPELGKALGLLLVWLVLAASEPTLSHRWSWYFPIYLVSQTILVFVLLTMPDSPDFFAALLAIITMQVMLRLNPKIGAIWIGLCALLLVSLLASTYGTQTVALVLVYSAANALLGSYALATRRAQIAHNKNQVLALELQESDQKLQAYSTQLKAMAIARERNRMARELHDSVTQTVFVWKVRSKPWTGIVYKEDTISTGCACWPSQQFSYITAAGSLMQATGISRIARRASW